MCLLITQTTESTFLSDVWIEDFFYYNSDGIGVMFAENNELVVRKALPRTTPEAIKFWRDNVEGKECAIHLRMRTHGDVDLENCHPYKVLDGLWVMHNGVLAVGNEDDPKKSDTWHYIERYLKPLLKGDIDLAFDPAFIEVISEHIGISNKLVMMDYKGRLAHYNYTSGVTWEGRWLSNTYAWTAPDQKRRSKYNSYYSNVSAYGDYDYEWEGNQGKIVYPTVQFTPEEDDTPRFTTDYEVSEVVDYLDASGHHRAASVSKQQLKQFVYKFDSTALWDLAGMLDQGEIDEYQFVNFVSDFRKYREMVCGC